MIKFNNLSQEVPYLIFKEHYDRAMNAEQKNIEVIAISSYNKEEAEVDSRFVNLKFIDHKQFIFFSNYNSPKSIAFDSHKQISALFYWPFINVQIRMKSEITKTSIEYNQEYFKNRSIAKNVLAISSNQSQEIKSYEHVIRKYNDTMDNNDLLICPDYWGGFSFTPYYFEFWEGNNSRLNKRDVYQIRDKNWEHIIIQP